MHTVGNKLQRLAVNTVKASEEDEAMINALRQAISIRTEYRKKYPLFQLSVMSEDSNDNKLAESATSTWYKEIVVDDIDKWTYFVTHPHKMSKEPIQWIFRGQGDARWHLESSLFRQVGGSRDFDSIVKIETNSMNFFRRETYDSSLCQSLKGVNLLAVMQHYGSATRLLDFTYAPLTALFFAIDQRAQLLSNTNSYFAHHVKQSLHDNSNLDIGNPDDNVWVAVWAFNLRAILGNLLTDNNSDLNLALIKSTEEANKIIENSIGHSGDKGIDVVLPMTGNERLSAQSGLFLMAKDMGKPFEENLRATLPFPLKITLEDCERVKISSITDWNDIVRKFSVVKFVFRSAVIEDLDMMLRSLHMTYKTVYPDLSGIAKDATANLG